MEDRKLGSGAAEILIPLKTGDPCETICNGILSEIVPGIMDTVEREIYRMGLKHGMKQAAISGVASVFSDDDIFRVKELALKEIKKAKKNPL
jgi:hypothetical protein